MNNKLIIQGLSIKKTYTYIQILTSYIAKIYQPISPSGSSGFVAMKWSFCFLGNSSLAHVQVLLLIGRSCLLRRCPLPLFHNTYIVYATPGHIPLSCRVVAGVKNETYAYISGPYYSGTVGHWSFLLFLLYLWDRGHRFYCHHCMRSQKGLNVFEFCVKVWNLYGALLCRLHTFTPNSKTF